MVSEQSFSFFKSMACRELLLLLCLWLCVCVVSRCQCASLTGLEALHGWKQTDNLNAIGQHHGRLLIGQNQHGGQNGSTTTEDFLLNVGRDFQADMGWAEPTDQPGVIDRPMQDMATVQRLLRLEPKVECTLDSIMLQLHDAASTPLFFVDRGYRLPPLPLSKLPSSCGYNIRSTHSDLVLVAPYDGCFVAHEADSYVLPLRWWGLPLRVSCPLIKQPSPNPPMVTCHAEGMVVTTEWNIAASRIQVHVNGHWEPLLKASHRCRFSVIEHPEGVVISVHYVPCIDKKDGLYTLELAGDAETKITCPSLLVAPPAPPRKNLTAPPNSGSVHPSYPTYQKPDTPQVQSSPQIPLMKNQNPSLEQKNTQRSHLAYYIFHPRILDAKPLALDSPPTEISINSVSTKMPTVQASKDQQGQMLYHFSYLPQPPESPPIQPQMNKRPSENPGEELTPFKNTPVLPQKSVVSATIAGGPEQVAHFLFYNHQHAPHAPPLEAPAPHPQYPEKPELRTRFSETPPMKKRTWALQPEAPNSQSYPVYPQQKVIFSPAMDPTGLPAPPSHGANRFHHIKPKPGFPLGEAFPQKQILQPFHPQSKTIIQPPGKSEAVHQSTHLDTSQGHVRQPLHSSYQKSKPEPPSSETPNANPQSHKAEAPKAQLHQPLHLYPTLESDSQPGANSPTGQPQRPCDLSKSTNDGRDDDQTSPEKPTINAQPRTSQTQPEQNHHPLYLFFYPQISQQPQSPAPYFVYINPQVPLPVGDLKPPEFDAPPPADGDTVPETPMQFVPCSQSCPIGFPNCCPQISIHQHLHQIFPIITESKDAPAFYLNPVVLHPVTYSDVGDGLLSLAPTPSEVTSPTASLLVPLLLRSLPSGDMEQQYPLEGSPAPLPTNNLSISANVNMPVLPYFEPDLLYEHWFYSPPDHQSKDQSPAHSSVASDPLPVKPEPAQNVPSEGASSPDLLFFIDQYLQQQQKNKPTAMKQMFIKEPSNPLALTHLESQHGLDQFLIPYSMLQDSPVENNPPFNNSKPKPTSSESKNSSKHVQTLDSEKKSFELQKHSPPGLQHHRFNDSLKSFKDIVHHLHKVTPSLGRTRITASPDTKISNPEQQKISLPNWLGEDIPIPVPGNVLYMATHDVTSVAENPHLVITPHDLPQLKTKYPESLRGFWKSLLSPFPGQSLPPHVPGKTVQRRNTITGMKEAPLAKSGSEKH